MFLNMKLTQPVVVLWQHQRALFAVWLVCVFNAHKETVSPRPSNISHFQTHLFVLNKMYLCKNGSALHCQCLRTKQCLVQL